MRWPAPSAALPRVAGRVELVAGSLAWLRACAVGDLGWVSTRRATIIVSGWEPPRRGWAGRLGPLPGVVSHDVRLPRPGGGRTVRRRAGRAVVRVVLDAPRPLYAIVGAALRALGPHADLPATVSPDVGTLDAPPAWLPPDANTAAFVGPNPDENVIRPYDVVVDASLSGVDTVLVDAAVVNPRGFRPPARSVDATLTSTSDGWAVHAGALLVARGGFDLLDEQQMAAVRTVRAIDCGQSPPDLLVRLALTGVVLRSEDPPASLAGELAAILREPTPPLGADPIEWELRSVRQRRAALRHHATGIVLPALADDRPPGSGRPSVSALVVSDRPDRMAAAIAAMDAQTYPELEIVVGLRGTDERVAKAVAECGRPIRVVESAELTDVVAHAHGALLTRIDEADVYGPEHIWDLVLARHYSGATVVGKASEFVHLGQLGVTVRRTVLRSETYAGTVAGGTLLLSRADLDSLGGWPAVDRDLLDRVGRDGGLVYRTHPFGFVYMRHVDDSAEGLEYFLHRSGPQWTGPPPYPEFGQEPPAMMKQTSVDQRAKPSRR